MRAFSSYGKRGHSSSRCAGLSLSRPLLLRSTGSRRAGSVVVAHGPSCSAACGMFPDQGSNPCSLHWQADSQPLHHQGSPVFDFFKRLGGKYQRRIFCDMWKLHGLHICAHKCFWHTGMPIRLCIVCGCCSSYNCRAELLRQSVWL